MPADTDQSAWFGHSSLWNPASDGADTREFARMWNGFMLARFTLALVLLALQLAFFAWGQVQTHGLWLASLIYFAGSLTAWYFDKPRMLGTTFTGAWLRLVGLDIATFAVLQFLHPHAVNYTPLFGLPVLLAAVLGTLQLALGTAAGVSMLLLGTAVWGYWHGLPDAASALAQAALSGIGYFAIALLANQLAMRLARVGQSARRNQLAAHVQRQVNELVIESLPHGVLIVDSLGRVLGANPAARALLQAQPQARAPLVQLADVPAWSEVLALTKDSIAQQLDLQAEISITHPGQGPRRIRVHTRLTHPLEMDTEVLCVLFLQDQRELEARLRTEKLASMGRMSTAVAHDIRNPLAAISQANALLEEELDNPRQRRLTSVVAQNTKRLSSMVDDILNATRVRSEVGLVPAAPIHLCDAVERTCRDWASQNPGAPQLQVLLDAADPVIQFDSNHLRRILVNLLDNALRHASGQPGCIQVHVEDHGPASPLLLEVWSDSAPMDPSVQQHLFEPFFSSESRSNGLGLYICRELCESHGASIHHERRTRALPVAGGHSAPQEGNAFVLLIAQLAVNSAGGTVAA